MAGEQREQHERGTIAPQAGHEQQVCPACGSPVDTVLRRRKSLGIFIPEWVPGSCRNPECPRYTSPAGQGG
ncbi:hypothetical protein ACFCZ1_13305 [Streptomyces sp. NPDC056224]|uniref:hypothetical protein n=1 Tax=Streptomyces sp. NPDC056224 TaxID=3345750 RepID=UPI0035E2035C